ncbi:MAG: hypothetical protein QOC68_1305 [Solirubrobacteraceae bacterium]|nr:hypothetical protein [Solirubrobacteraceae bacterium]
MGSIASRFALLASAVCIVVAVLALYARSAILDPGHFADRAVGALAQDEVAGEIATRFSAGVIERSPGLVTLRPALENAAADVVTSPQFAAAFGVGMRELHRGVFTGSDPRPALRVPGMAAQVRAAVAARTPVLAQRLPVDAEPSLMSIGGNVRERGLLDVASRAGGPTRLAPIVLVVGLLGLLLVALTARDRRRGLWASGLALALAGGALVAAWIGARTLTLEGFDTSWGDAVVKTIWGAYLGDLRTWSLGLAGAGIVVAAAAARPEQRERPSWARVPAPLRGAALLVTGAVVLADRDLALDLAAAAVAGVLLYLGARHLLAGRARIALAGAALLALATGVAVAASGPERAPQVVAATATTPPAPSGSPRICFASMQDARAAAESAAIPKGAVVKTLSDGRVCVRSR